MRLTTLCLAGLGFLLMAAVATASIVDFSPQGMMAVPDATASQLRGGSCYDEQEFDDQDCGCKATGNCRPIQFLNCNGIVAFGTPEVYDCTDSLGSICGYCNSVVDCKGNELVIGCSH
jgi:hypothetical protein